MPLLLSPVDSEEGRRGLARTLPKRVLNAATGGTTITLSTHAFGDGKACLHCLYPLELNRRSPEQMVADDLGIALDVIQDLLRTNRPVGAELVSEIERNRGVDPGTWAGHVDLPVNSFYVRAVCGDARVQMPTANVIAPLSFISASAGVLLAAELVKAGNQQVSGWYWTITSASTRSIHHNLSSSGYEGKTRQACVSAETPTISKPTNKSTPTDSRDWCRHSDWL